MLVYVDFGRLCDFAALKEFNNFMLPRIPVLLFYMHDTVRFLQFAPWKFPVVKNARVTLLSEYRTQFCH